MTKFLDILDEELNPAEQQKQAAKNLANVVRDSNLKWWKDKPSNIDNYVLLAVAVYSILDLMFLDFLNKGLCSTPIYIADVDDCYHMEKIKEFCKTPPIYMFFEKDSIVDFKQSVDARRTLSALFNLKTDGLEKEVKQYFLQVQQDCMKHLS